VGHREVVASAMRDEDPIAVAVLLVIAIVACSGYFWYTVLNLG